MDMRLLPEAARMQVLERRCAMTTNYEWLLNMGGEERQAWFDAEHNDTLAPENVVTSDDVDANDGNDTREKLEADVREFSNVYYVNNFHVYDKVIELLDRQAAMTEREMVDRYTNELRKFKDMNNDAGEEIAELQSQLDEIAELVGWHGEVDGNSGESLLVPMVGAMCEGSEVAAKLKAERDELREKLGIALDHAHDLLSLVNLDGEVIS